MRGEDLQIDRGLQDQLDFTIGDALTALKKRQQADGHLIFDLEADATIPAEYIFLNHHLDEREPELEQKLARYIRSIQQDEGGWPLYHGGAPDISASVKAYLALKITGDSPDQPHMPKPVPLSIVWAAQKKPMCSPAMPWRCLAKCRGGRCRSCRWN
ncbi:hypothetical protein JCM17843_17510 [Kordiimonadales bacterium JCM 17843]|nr:hypothetical protein JCM17843_17510 [Kordiimonadales bacterium JCM 17843]